jgi:hypothetical protein
VRLKRVLHQLLDQFESLRTHGTRVGPALVRFESVLLQLVLARVALFAQVAGERPLAGVRAHMALEVVGCREAARAKVARVALCGRSLAVVVLAVRQQALGVREEFGAALALQLGRVQVHVHVLGQQVLVQEADAAEVAAEATPLRLDVQPPVQLHEVARAKLLGANVAHGGDARAAVSASVLVQLLRRGERRPAHAALPSANTESVVSRAAHLALYPSIHLSLMLFSAVYYLSIMVSKLIANSETM